MSDTKIIDVGNGWKRAMTQKTVPIHRDGIRGVWDCIKAWVTRTPRLSVPAEMTFSVYVKAKEEGSVFGPQLEIKIKDNHDRP